MKIKLRFWQAGSLLASIAKFFEEWWSKLLEKMVIFDDIKKMDEETCSIEMVDLLAYERGIRRIKDEDDTLYRLRVKYAYLNAVDAGSVAGFERIWARLQLGEIKQQERSPELDWDIITLTLNRAKFDKRLNLLDELILLYGRTCRRYYFIDELEVKLYFGVAQVSFVTSELECDGVL